MAARLRRPAPAAAEADVEAAGEAYVRDLPKWEATAGERVRSGIHRFSKALADLIDRDANEGDTRVLVIVLTNGAEWRADHFSAGSG